jgi:hypothetical protein
LAGHYSPETGRTMEDLFVSLIERIGYRVSRRGVGAGGLDVIAEFTGIPIKAKAPSSCKLLKPSFSPSGTTAFSLKKRDLLDSDVTELIKYAEELNEKSRGSKGEQVADIIPKSITGLVIVTNFTKTEAYLDQLLSKNVHCWDGRRLLFYSSKAKAIQELSMSGNVEEYLIKELPKIAYLKQIETHEGSHKANIVVFVDVHEKNFKVSADHIKTMLLQIYRESLQPIVMYAQSIVSVKLQIHSLGLLDEELVRRAYDEYAVELTEHPQVLFDELIIYEYDSAPWAILFR